MVIQFYFLIMPSATCHLTRARCLVNLYIQHQHFYKHHLAHHEAFLNCLSQVVSPQPYFTSSPLGTLSSLFSSSDTTSESQDTSAQSNLDSEHWLGTSGSELSSISDFNAMDLDVLFRYEDSDSEDSDSDGDSKWGTGWDGTSGGSDGDDEESMDSDGEDTMMLVRSQFHTFVCIK